MLVLRSALVEMLSKIRCLLALSLALQSLDFVSSAIHRTAECGNRVCLSTFQCNLELYDQILDVDYQSPTEPQLSYCLQNKNFIKCRDCRLPEDEFSVKVQVTGITDHEKLLGYSATLLQAVNDMCPKIRCNILFFKGTPLLSRYDFFTFPGVWDMASTTLIAPKIQTKLYFIKYIHGKAVGAIDPIDLVRLLSTSSVRESLIYYHNIRIQVKDVDTDYKNFVEKEIEDGREGTDIGMPDNKNVSTVSSLNARIMVLILFGVLLFTVFVSIALFKAKPRCLRHFYSLNSLQRTSSTQDVIQNNGTEIPTSSTSIQGIAGIDNFMQPPPYTDDDMYRKDNPPPRYEEISENTENTTTPTTTNDETITITTTTTEVTPTESQPL